MSELNVPNAEPTGLTPRVDDAVENLRGAFGVARSSDRTIRPSTTVRPNESLSDEPEHPPRSQDVGDRLVATA